MQKHYLSQEENLIAFQEVNIFISKKQLRIKQQMSSQQQKSAKKGPEKNLISRPNPISVILRMDVPLIRKTPVGVFNKENQPDCFLNLKSNGILHCLWSADLSKSFSQLIELIFTFPKQQFLPIFIFSQYFFQQILPGGKMWVSP